MAKEKIKDQLTEIRGAAADVLKEREQDIRMEMFKLRTTSATEKVKDTTKFRKMKKEIARIQTVLRQKELKTAKA